jgi:hypothetical protein
MRILLTSHCAPLTIGGTQTWNRTVADELGRRGHEVTTLSKDAHTYPFVDLAIVSQNTSFEKARAVASYVIFVTHGPGDIEMPPEGADSYFVVSEELAHPQAEIARQPIDTDFWRPSRGIAQPPIDVVRVSYYGGMEWLQHLCDSLALTFRLVKEETDPKALRDMYNRARIVVASGRSALEAMSCNRPVILADQRSYNGRAPLAMMDIEEAMKTNYSGRGGERMTEDGMRLALKWGIALAGNGRRDHVLRHHEVGAIVDQLMESLPEG